MGNQAYTFLTASADPRHWNAFYQCAVYKIYVPPEIIDYYLPNRLVAFAENTRMNVANRIYFFSEEAAPVTRSVFDDYIDQIPFSVSFDYFLEKLSKEKDSNIRYNYIITDNYLIFIRTPYFSDRSSRLLPKHITISSRAPLVRYAGEIWYNGSFLVNNSSGTYRPSDQSIAQMVRFFQHLSPNVHFRGLSFRISALPSFRQAI